MGEIFKNGLVGQTVIYKKYMDAGEYTDAVGLVVDKVIAEAGASSTTRFLIMDNDFNITPVSYNKIKKIVVSTEFENAE
jgi:uncharacterized protein YqeY